MKLNFNTTNTTSHQSNTATATATATSTSMLIKVILNNNNTLETFENSLHYKKDLQTDAMKTFQYLFNRDCKKGITKYHCKGIYREVTFPLTYENLLSLKSCEEVRYSITPKDPRSFTSSNTRTFFKCEREEWLQLENVIKMMEEEDGIKISIVVSIKMYNAELYFEEGGREKLSYNGSDKDDILLYYNCHIEVEHLKFFLLQDFEDEYGPYTFTTLEELKEFILNELPFHFGEKYKTCMEFQVIQPSRCKKSHKKKRK